VPPPVQPTRLHTRFDVGTSRSSRPKRKCFKKRTTHSDPPEPLSNRIPSSQSREANLPTLSNKTQGNERDPEFKDQQPKSRPKKKCRFGPHKGGDSNGPTALKGKGVSSKDDRGYYPLSQSSPTAERTQGRIDGEPINPTTTLAPPPTIKRTPFDRYKRIYHPEPRFDPYRFVHQKLGVSATEFEDRVNEEIEDLFQEIDRERRQALLETVPFERTLSKEDCFRLFSDPDIPRTGSVLGVLKWASDSQETPSSPHHQ
jgi:hypothetical protein